MKSGYKNLVKQIMDALEDSGVCVGLYALETAKQVEEFAKGKVSYEIRQESTWARGKPLIEFRYTSEKREEKCEYEYGEIKIISKIPLTKERLVKSLINIINQIE